MQSRRYSRGRIRAASLVVASSLVGCEPDLGECDMEQAQVVVYGGRQQQATAGQALAHDGCGSGGFCHSSGAVGENRKGAPKGMDFDMLPEPHGWMTLWNKRELAWKTVADGVMPPGGKAASVVGDSGWYTSFDRDEDSRLPPITSKEGKEIFRNWLACDAPTVRETKIEVADSGVAPRDAEVVAPRDAEIEAEAGMEAGQGDPPDASVAAPNWKPIYTDLIAPSCVTGCHTEGGLYEKLDLSELCVAYEQLLTKAPCGERRVVPGDADSLLVRILGEEQTECENARQMPLVPPYFSSAEQKRVAEWVEAGAKAEGCE